MDAINKIRAAYAPYVPTLVETADENGEFPPAEDEMIDVAVAWHVPEHGHYEPYIVKIAMWMDNRPIAPGATHIAYCA